MARLALYLAAAAALCVVAVDVPVAHWVAAHETHPAAWTAVLHVLEYVIGIAPWRYLGVTVLVTGTIASLVWRRGQLGWITVTFTHLLALNLTMWIKFLTGRIRPHQWHGGSTWFHDGSSFPSGHVALFASLVVPLVAVYPRLRWLLAIPIYAALARVMAQAHFTSDVVAGFSLCCAVTALALPIARRVQRRGDAR